jgi:rhamnose transport system substrate-binding protein
LRPCAAAAEAETLKIAMVVENLGNGFFEAANRGGQEAVAALKKDGKADIDFIYIGPTTPTAEGQIDIINNLIAQNVNAIVISANDPDALVPVGKKAMNRGIPVISFDSGVSKDGRIFQINPSSPELIGKKQI